mgnify:CR=1 FL=1
MIQLQVLNYILNTKDYSLITLNNLNEKYFSNYTSEFRFIKNHVEAYNQVCDIETFLAAFPNFKDSLFIVNEKPSYLIEELIKDYKQRTLAETFNKIKQKVLSGDTDGAMAEFNASNDLLTKIGVSLSCVDLLKDTSRYDAYLEKVNDIGKYYLSTGFKELDKILGGIDRQEELGVVVARTNRGKCLAKGTRVLMADGSTKAVEDIIVGDKVQSLGRINTVLALHNGHSKGYKIIPNIGEPFIVSENHILTVMQLKEYWDKNKKKMVTNGEFELRDIMIEDYLEQSSHTKHLTKLYRPSIDYEKKEQLIPSYILGLWLGDGTSCRPELTSMDEPIINEWCSYAKSLGLVAVKRENARRKSKANAYDITAGTKKSVKNGSNKALQLLQYYNLINNKHIPLNYLTGDREQRLELLAGLLDTDGYFDKNGFEITQKSLTLIQQIAQLARGLNLKVGAIHTKTIKGINYYRIKISGNTNIIPTRLDRKHTIRENIKQSEYIVTSFKVEQVDHVEYYGFMCDGDSRYLLADNTLTHNTWILLKMATAAVCQGLRVGIYSGEMSENKVGYRVDTLLGHISNGSLTHGNGDVKDAYKKYLDSLGNYKGCLKVLTPQSINGAATVSALESFIQKEQLDILFIDQLSLLEDGRYGKTPVEKASNISKDLKLLQVKLRLPIISVSQQNRSKNDADEDSIDTTQLAMSDRIAQDATFIIGIAKNKKDDTILELQIVKSRDSVAGGKLQYKVNLNLGEFIYIPNEKDNVTTEEDLQELAATYNEPVMDTEEVF